MVASSSQDHNQTLAIVVPTLNAAKLWPAFNDGLRGQGLDPKQILIIDSSSTDGTPELARASGYRVLSIPRAEFNHGGTRQAAVELLEGANILVFLTQDAILASHDAILRLVQQFDNPAVAAAYGRQLPRKGAGAIELHARLFNYPPISDLRSASNIKTLGFKTIFFSNSFGAYRRSALQAVGGFPLGLRFGEDTLVAARLIVQNWKIAYVAEAQVFHSHDYSLVEEFQRYRSVGSLHAEHSWLLTDFGTTSGEGVRFVKSEIQHLARFAPYLIPIAILRTGLKYLGYRWGHRISRRQEYLKSLERPATK